MSAGISSVLSKDLGSLFREGTLSGLTDGQLLERFLSRRGDGGEAAFTALVERHGPMVYRVCRDVLGNSEDAQDAFQATFLVLVRSSQTIRKRESVQSWLFGVGAGSRTGHGSIRPGGEKGTWTRRAVSDSCTRSGRSTSSARSSTTNWLDCPRSIASRYSFATSKG